METGLHYPSRGYGGLGGSLVAGGASDQHEARREQSALLQRVMCVVCVVCVVYQCVYVWAHPGVHGSDSSCSKLPSWSGLARRPASRYFLSRVVSLCRTHGHADLHGWWGRALKSGVGATARCAVRGCRRVVSDSVITVVPYFYFIVLLTIRPYFMRPQYEA